MLRFVVLALAVLQVAVTRLPDLTGYGENIETRSDAVKNPATPAGYAFAIWGLIYAACLAFAVYQALPANRGSALLDRVRGPAAAAFLANASWPVYVQLRQLDAVSVALIVAVLAPLLVAVARVHAAARVRRLTAAEWGLVWFPFSVFAGWVTVATFANLAAAIKLLGGVAVAGVSLSDRETAVGLVIAAAGVAATVTSVTRGNVAYALACAWGLAAIAVANAAPNADPVADREVDRTVVVVAVGMVSLLALALVGAVAAARSPRFAPPPV